MVRVFQEKKLDIVNCKEKGENMKRIVQICLIKLPENVKVIARAGAGVNNIPVEQCAENGIVVFKAVCPHTFLSALRLR